jgi:subtilisin family serine protease
MRNRLLVTLIVLSLAFGGAAPAMAQGPEETATAGVISADLSAALAAGGDGTIDVLVETDSQNYGAIIDAIEGMGGTVSQTFKYADGLAATMPKESVSALADVSGVEQVSLDVIRSPIPTSGDAAAPGARPVGGMDPEAANELDDVIPAGEAFYLDAGFETVTLTQADIEAGLETYDNMFSMNATPVWDTGNLGQDSLVAVIDTGIYDQHFMLAGSVVGGVDLSPDAGTPFEGFNLASNHWHGTHVSGIVAGHGAILLGDTDPLVESIEFNGGSLPDFAPGIKLMPLLGMAPAAQLYGIKVFPHTGAGVPESVIIAGIEHAIDQKESGALDIDVINMSLGGASLFDGRDLEDQVVDFATSIGITVVSAASNDGPTSMTINSPGSANTSITVGAVAQPFTTRVFWDMNFFPFVAIGIGELLYTDNDPQMIYFSSRGPTSDGREKPTASANGVFVLSSFNLPAAPQSLAWASGTSMATPGMAGTVALLNTYGEGMGASPYDYKQAVVAGSSPIPDFADWEQGAGLIDAAAAMDALQADGNLGQSHPGLRRGFSHQSVKPEGKQIQNVNSRKGWTYQIRDLAPGHSEHFYFDLHPNAEKITVEFSNVDLGVDLGLNAFELYVNTSRTFLNPYVDSVNIWGDAVIEIESLSTSVSGLVFGLCPSCVNDLPLMPGYVRVVIENDWTSFDSLSGTVTINVETGNNSAKADETYSGSLNTGESVGFFPVGFGPNGAELELSWMRDWTVVPASDMDLIVAWFDTGGGLHFEFGAATLNSPEKVIIDSSDIDTLLVLVDGFNTNGLDEPWELHVTHR